MLALQRGSQYGHDISTVLPKMPKIAQNDQKNTIFNLRQVYTPSQRPDGGQNAVFTPLGSWNGCKNRTWAHDLNFFWGVDLVQVKNCVFLVILSDFGWFSKFWAKPLKYHGHIAIPFGVQTLEENGTPPLIGVTRGHLMDVFCHLMCVVGTKTPIRWPLVTPMRDGVLFSSNVCTPKGIPIWPWYLNGFSQNAQNC